jgi:hypothetical protein
MNAILKNGSRWSNATLVAGALLSVGAVIFWTGFQYGTIHDLKVRVATLAQSTSEVGPRLATIQSEMEFQSQEIHQINDRLERLAKRQRERWKEH